MTEKEEARVATDLDRFVAAEGREELIAEVRRRIDAEGVTYVYYQFPSVTGRIMGKGVPAAHWESMARKGFQLVYGATANLFTDRHGEYIGYGPEAAELVGIPEPETFEVLPWDKKVARVWCTCFRNREERKDPASFLTSDCRGNLKRIQAQFEEATGLHLRAGAEPEMMWLNLKEDGTPDVSGVTKPYCYHIDQFSELQPIIHKVIEYGQALGLDMIQGDHEDAPGQIELNFNFDRAEKTADNLSTYRQVCRQVGRELGAFPCFMPKPFMGVSANGCHHNISLWRGDENAFMPETDDNQLPSQIGLYAIGGILEHLGALTAVTASTVNSYRRLWDTGFWAPVFADWGFQNRTTALRVSAPGPVRVPLGRLGGEPVPVDGGADHGDVGRDRAEARSRAAGGAEHLRCDGGGKAGQQDPDDVRRRARRARGGRGDQEGPSRRDVHGVHALQAGRVGAVLRDGDRLGRG